MKKTAFSLALAFMLNSCFLTKKEVAPSVNGTMSASIDGKSWSDNKMIASAVLGGLGITTENETGEIITHSIVTFNGTGTYNYDDLINSSYYTNGNTIYYVKSGSIIITKYTAPKNILTPGTVEGTFSGSYYNASLKKTVQITNGKFSIPVTGL